MTRLTGRAKHGIQSEVQMRKGIARKYYLHILPCVWKSIVRCSEEPQYRVKEQQAYSTEENTHDYIQHHAVTQHLIGYGIVTLSQFHAYECGRTHTYCRTECSREVHERKGDSQSRNRQYANALADEDAVHHIVERSGYHSDDSGQGILHQQSSDWFRAQLQSGFFIIHLRTLFI